MRKWAIGIGVAMFVFGIGTLLSLAWAHDAVTGALVTTTIGGVIAFIAWIEGATL